MNSLVKKKYTERIRSEEDRRVVYIRLTEKGIKAYHHHEEFHKKMTDAVVEALGSGRSTCVGEDIEQSGRIFQKLQMINSPHVLRKWHSMRALLYVYDLEVYLSG